MTAVTSIVPCQSATVLLLLSKFLQEQMFKLYEHVHNLTINTSCLSDEFNISYGYHVNNLQTLRNHWKVKFQARNQTMMHQSSKPTQDISIAQVENHTLSLSVTDPYGIWSLRFHVKKYFL